MIIRKIKPGDAVEMTLMGSQNQKVKYNIVLCKRNILASSEFIKHRLGYLGEDGSFLLLDATYTGPTFRMPFGRAGNPIYGEIPRDIEILETEVEAINERVGELLETQRLLREERSNRAMKFLNFSNHLYKKYDKNPFYRAEDLVLRTDTVLNDWGKDSSYDVRVSVLVEKPFKDQGKSHRYTSETIWNKDGNYSKHFIKRVGEEHYREIGKRYIEIWNEIYKEVKNHGV